MDIEKKLLEYRKRKERKEFINKYKSKISQFFSLSRRKVWQPSMNSESPVILKNIEQNVERQELLLYEDCDESLSVTDDDIDNVNCCSYTDLIYYTLCLILWVSLYAVFIKLQFGTVFLIVSAIVGMYFNTRTGPKKQNEVSAYSVFNKNCDSIDGTLKAEQFEREIRYGPAVVL